MRINNKLFIESPKIQLVTAISERAMLLVTFEINKEPEFKYNFMIHKMSLLFLLNRKR